MLALDPPLGDERRATIGGVMATADSGPLRHRYGGIRDLVVGVTVALSDGTLAKSGGKVIKNVAGYDLAKLFAGSYGTLGLIVRVAVRLHPLPPRTATAIGGERRPGRRWPPPRPRWRASRSRPTAWTSTGARARGGCSSASAARRPPTRPPRPSRGCEALGLEERAVREDDDELWMPSGPASAGAC